MLEGVGEDMTIQKQEKNFFFYLCIVDLDTITGVSDKPNSVIRRECGQTLDRVRVSQT